MDSFAFATAAASQLQGGVTGAWKGTIEAWESMLEVGSDFRDWLTVEVGALAHYSLIVPSPFSYHI